MEYQDAQKGDVVLLMITGMTGRYEGKVIEIDQRGYPIIEVEKSGPFSRLKNGDYVLLKRRLAVQ